MRDSRFDDSISNNDVEIGKLLVEYESWHEDNPEKDINGFAIERQLPQSLADQLKQTLSLGRLFVTSVDRRRPLAPTENRLENGTWIDNFCLEKPIGTGGMGTVWLAEQREPIKRRVAVKLLNRDSNSDDLARRLEFERQTLANMSHPNIANIIGGGVYEGQPCYVMEYVPDSEAITTYCNKNGLELRPRLELFCSYVLQSSTRISEELFTEISNLPTFS